MSTRDAPRPIDVAVVQQFLKERGTGGGGSHGNAFRSSHWP